MTWLLEVIRWHHGKWLGSWKSSDGIMGYIWLGSWKWSDDMGYDLARGSDQMASWDMAWLVEVIRWHHRIWLGSWKSTDGIMGCVMTGCPKLTNCAMGRCYDLVPKVNKLHHGTVLWLDTCKSTDCIMGKHYQLVPEANRLDHRIALALQQRWVTSQNVQCSEEWNSQQTIAIKGWSESLF